MPIIKLTESADCVCDSAMQIKLGQISYDLMSFVFRSNGKAFFS